MGVLRSATFILAAVLLAWPTTWARAAEDTPALDQIPVKGTVTLLDLGADKCIPCRMMAPILTQLREEYQGRAAVVFLDVWKDPSAASHFGIRVIPTQIFFDAKGREVFRHQGFLDKASLMAKLKELGVPPPDATQGQ